MAFRDPATNSFTTPSKALIDAKNRLAALEALPRGTRQFGDVVEVEIAAERQRITDLEAMIESERSAEERAERERAAEEAKSALKALRAHRGRFDAAVEKITPLVDQIVAAATTATETLDSALTVAPDEVEYPHELWHRSRLALVDALHGEITARLYGNDDAPLVAYVEIATNTLREGVTVLEAIAKQTTEEETP